MVQSVVWCGDGALNESQQLDCVESMKGGVQLGQ